MLQKIFGENWGCKFSSWLTINKNFDKFYIMVFQRLVQNPIRHLKMKLFVAIVNSWKLLTIFTKSSILDTWQCFKYTFLFNLAMTCLSSSYSVYIYLVSKTKMVIKEKWKRVWSCKLWSRCKFCFLISLSLLPSEFLRSKVIN